MATKPKSRSTNTGVATPESGTLPTAPAAQATAGDRQVLIAEAAFYLAQSRGFGPGGELGDWLAAERLIAERLAQAVGAALADDAGTAASAAGPEAETAAELEPEATAKPVVEPAAPALAPAAEPAPPTPRKRASKATAAASVPAKEAPAAPAKKTATRRAK